MLRSNSKPMFHPSPSILLFPSPLKFSKEVWSVTAPRTAERKNDWQLQKLEGTKYCVSACQYVGHVNRVRCRLEANSCAN